ncbi:ABC-2 transporter permease [Alkalihalobacillus sp. LMS6]|uniref:ABC-2 transporter permease n=1 Tax=Alkalihalobacillus sp. LMS6 TaxID=2924034 RepID=UPI0020D0B2CF|nr:ABC-2 transporter permease [Alkalihalobacillus sp. LMS6]UTR07073.1 ABC-2 transporter permease [Alkalihalobacillus sp. LMS6]
MIALLLKEWHVNVWYTVILSGIGILGGLLLGNGSLPLMVAVLVTCLYALLSVESDHHNQSDLMIRVLPVCAREVVGAKYVATILIGFITTIAITLFNRLLPGFSSLSWFEWGSAVGLIMLFVSIFYPLMYRFGRRVITATSVFVIMIFPAGSVVGFSVNGIVHYVVQEVGIFVFGSGMLLVVTLSFGLSTYFYQKYGE